MAASSHRLDDDAFDDAARALFAQLDKEEKVDEKKGKTAAWGNRYRPLNAVWKNPKEGGGTVFVGNLQAAGSREILAEHTITNVVNCQGENTTNYFEKDAEFRYFRFPVSMWMMYSGSSPEELFRFLRPFFDFVDAATERSENVLIHCLAGAHRAGKGVLSFFFLALAVLACVSIGVLLSLLMLTALPSVFVHLSSCSVCALLHLCPANGPLLTGTSGTLYLMYAGGYGYKDALKIAKRRRPVIDPISHLGTLLARFETAREQLEGDQDNGSATS
jgi:Dual specificity phosphatase, catalytic domain